MPNIRIYLTEPACQPEDVEKRYLSSSGIELKWYEEALARTPAATGGLGWNPSLMSSARAAKRAGISLTQLKADIKKATPGEIPPGRLKEIDRAYERTNVEVRPAKMIPVVTTEKPAPILLPDPLENETEQFLKALFEPDENIVIAPAQYNEAAKRENPDDTRREAKTRDEWIATFQKTAPDEYFKTDIGIYIKINPMKKGNKPGTRMPLADDASVTDYRWLLVEGDEDSKEEQLGAIHAAGLPYASVVDSGNKSLHALVRLDADSHEDYKKQTNDIYHSVGKLIVVDEANGNPARYSRLPGCTRSKTGRQSLIEVYSDVPSVKENNRQQWLSGAFTLAEYYRMEMPQEHTLLGNRFLCREGSMLFVGPSGIGKSSASVQSDVLWALGRPAFDIKPAFPLRILCVQAENDDGDMIEMVKGVFHGLRLTPDEIEAVGRNTLYRNYKESTGANFLKWLEKLIDAYRPDLVRLDPLQAYLGEDAKEVKAVADFCRSTLNPILSKYQCACIIAHHTPKTTGRDTKEWHATDWMYAGAGTADLTNWARCVMVIDPVVDSQEVFRFVAAKRWKRIGWTDQAGYPAFEKYFKHASGGSIYWETADKPADPEEKKKFCVTDIMQFIPETEPIPKAALLALCQANGIGINKARSAVDSLVYKKQLFETHHKRSGTRDEIFISLLPIKAQTEMNHQPRCSRP